MSWGRRFRARARRWIRRRVGPLVYAFAALSFLAPPAGADIRGCTTEDCKRSHRAQLHQIRQCETGSQPHPWRYDGPSGFDGGFQFSPSTWSVTGSRYAYAHLAPRLEQRYRAVVWAQAIGWQWSSTAGWPNCA